jgi:hypothetical protein
MSEALIFDREYFEAVITELMKRKNLSRRRDLMVVDRKGLLVFRADAVLDLHLGLRPVLGEIDIVDARFLRAAGELTQVSPATERELEACRLIALFSDIQSAYPISFIDRDNYSVATAHVLVGVAKRLNVSLELERQLNVLTLRMGITHIDQLVDQKKSEDPILWPEVADGIARQLPIALRRGNHQVTWQAYDRFIALSRLPQLEVEFAQRVVDHSIITRRGRVFRKGAERPQLAYCHTVGLLLRRFHYRKAAVA